MTFTRRQFGNKAPTKTALATALRSLLTLRAKPYSDRDLESIANSHKTTPDAVKAQLRELGKGALIQSDAWTGARG